MKMIIRNKELKEIQKIIIELEKKYPKWKFIGELRELNTLKTPSTSNKKSNEKEDKKCHQ